LLLTSLGFSAAVQAQPDSLEQLANDFWAWRAKHGPFTSDDVNRLERPGGMRDWSRASIDRRRKDLAGFEARWKKLNPAQWPIPKQVDYKLIGSALSRVRWELEVNPRWKRDPNFYIEQTLTALAEALTIPAPYDETRSREILTRIENIPSILQQGSENLDKPPAPFATVAVQNLDGIRDRLRTMASALVGLTTLKAQELNAATDGAANALEKFQQQLKDELPKLPQQTALGRDAYIWFLRNVALMPFTPQELLAMGRQEWNRAVAFEAYEKNRNKDLPALKIAMDVDTWIKDAADKELQVRKFLEERGILTVPKWVQHYTLRPTPQYLRALEFTEHDDFTSPSRLNENCIRYVPEPSEKLGYFWRATAMDPRPITVHEGIPGHYFQLCLSWKNEDPIRRHYYDSGANEGIGFYAEEMMLQAGLFDDSPRSREIIDNMVRKNLGAGYAAYHESRFADPTCRHAGTVLIDGVYVKARLTAPEHDVHLCRERELRGRLAVPGNLNHLRGIDDNLAVPVRYRIGATAANVKIHAVLFIAEFNVVSALLVLDGDGVSVASRSPALGQGHGNDAILQGHCGFSVGDPYR